MLAEQVVPPPPAPVFILTGTAGVAGMWLPDYDTGLLDDLDSDDALLGFTIGVSGTIPMGAYGGWDGIVGYNFFGTFVDEDASGSSFIYDGDGTVVISGLSAPKGDSAIATSIGGGSVSVELTPPFGDPSSVSASGGTQAAATVVPRSSGFSLGAVALDGTDTVFGAIADASGGIFIATGDLTGLEIATDASRRVFYTGADLTFGLGSSAYGGTAVSAYVGPSYRGLFQDTETNVSLYLPEATLPVGSVTFPDFQISSNEELDSHYFGGVLGGTAAFGLSDGLILSLGAEGGVYGVHASLSGHESYWSGGGAFDDPNDSSSGVIFQDDINFSSDDFDLGSDDTIAFSAKGSAALTWAFSPSYALSLGGSVEYLSQVATIENAERIFESDYDSDAAWDHGSGASAEREFGWGSMVNFAITGSLTGSF